MKFHIAALLLFAPFVAAFAQSTDFPLKPIYPDATPVCSPDELKKVVIPSTTIESVTIESVTIDERDGAVRVTAIVTHPPAGDRVKVWVALPMKNWNGRFRGNGGGGFLTGNAESLRGAVAQGFAAAATDGGHEGGSGSFALNASGRLNWQEIRDFAYLGIHEMTVVGKALTQAFYGQPPRYSYFVGGSTGGRQGLMEAQRYPADYDGIFSGCPAIHWASMVPSTLWPQVVMHDAHHLVSWIDGGDTKVSNLALLCRRHHTDLHNGHWHVTITHGVVHVTRPSWAEPAHPHRFRRRAAAPGPNHPPTAPPGAPLGALFGGGEVVAVGVRSKWQADGAVLQEAADFALTGPPTG